MAPARLGVCCLYKAQVRLVEKLFSQYKNDRKLRICTVDGAQGSEADTVILVSVRTSRLGFTDDKNRMTVALSRVRRVLCTVSRHVTCVSTLSDVANRPV